MRKFWCFVLILAIVLTVAVPAFGEETGEPAAPETDPYTQGCKTLDGTMPIGGNQNIMHTCKAGFLYECNSDTVVYAYNADMRVEPGSLVKIMTCLLIGERVNPGESITLTENDLDPTPYDALTIDLMEGETVTYEQLLYAIMVESANDAVAVCAVRTCGSVEAFVEEMNNRAVKLGCRNTHFGNPYGLADGETYSTARDMAKIARAAMDVPACWEVYCSYNYDMPETNLSEARHFSTNNYMLYSNSMFNYYDGTVLGGKVGISSEDTWHVVENAEHNGFHFIVVTMEGENTVDKDSGATYVFGNLEDARTLLDYGYGDFKASESVCAGQAICQYAVRNGANDVVLGAKTGVKSVLPANMTSSEVTRTIHVDESLLKAPLEAGVTVGTLECWYRNNYIGSTDLVTMSPVAVNTNAQPLDAPEPTEAVETVVEPQKNTFQTVLEVFGAVFLVLLLFFAILTGRAMYLRAQRQRRRDARLRAERRRKP